MKTFLICVTAELVAFLSFSSGINAFAEQPKPASDEEIREAEVYDAMGEMIRRRDTLLKKFAVVLHGEQVTTGMPDSPIVSLPDVRARVVDAKQSFDLSAGYVVYDNNFEEGGVVVRRGDQYKGRHESLFMLPYIEKPKDEKLSEWLKSHRPAGCNPYDDYLGGCGGLMFMDSYKSIERIFFNRAKLVRTERGIGGRLISHWEDYSGKLTDHDYYIELSAADQMMPVTSRMQMTKIKHYFDEQRIQWKPHKDMLLPHRITAVQSRFNDPNVKTEYTFRCYWLVGDEVPDSIFIAEDPLAALLDQFEIVHSFKVGDKGFRFDHILPEDLYEDPTEGVKR